MLDLTAAFGDVSYEIKLLDGQELRLKRPTQAIQQTVMDVLPLVQSGDESKALPIIMNVFCRILNRNEDGITFEVEKLAEEYDLAVITYVVQDYFTYWNGEVSNNVNFQSSQQ